MKFTVLGSGSTGNAVLISSERTNVLVDAGLSAKEILRRLAAVGVDPADLDAILITHEHSDHAGGLRVMLGSVTCPVYISAETQDAFFSTRKGNQNGESESSKRRTALGGRSIAIESSREFRIGDIDFEPFSVPHDAADNFGFIAKRDGIRIAHRFAQQLRDLAQHRIAGEVPAGVVDDLEAVEIEVTQHVRALAAARGIGSFSEPPFEFAPLLYRKVRADQVAHQKGAKFAVTRFGGGGALGQLFRPQMGLTQGRRDG